MMNLVYRLLTIGILVPLMISAVLLLSTYYFSLVLAVWVLLGALEYSGLVLSAKHWQRALFLILTFGTIVVLCATGFAVSAFIFAVAGALLSLFSLVALVLFEPSEKPMWTQSPLIMFGAGWLSLIAGWVSLSAIHSYQPYGHWILFIFALVWATDTGAYIAGKLCGKRPFVSKVSPNKTMEGFIGGLVVALLLAVILHLTAFIPLNIFHWLGLALFVSLVSVVGDLIESVIKRVAEVKDSGRLLPGHGGILDRIDSLLAASPVFLLGLSFIY